MAVYLYTPYDDELLFGLVSRYLKAMRVQSTRHFAGSDIGTRNFNLEWWAQQTSVALGMTAREIAERLTLIPFIAAMRSRFVGGKEVDHANRVVLMRPGLASPQQLRYCRACFAGDMLEHHAPYWRRSHQLPGVLFCHIHEDILSETPSGLSNWDASDVDIALARGGTIPLETTQAQRENCVAMARFAHWIMTQRSAPLVRKDKLWVKEFQFEFCGYREGVYRSEVGSQELRERLLDHYGESFIEKCSALFTSGQRLRLDKPSTVGFLLGQCMNEASWDFTWPKCVNTRAQHGSNFRVNSIKRTATGWTAACECGCTFDYVRSATPRWARFHVSNVRIPTSDCDANR
ncbi:TniQ family protein [Paraburkholderia caribensis]|uniref:TniQ family protein n=1 Tax=Paraburkholderia caribensis TaxID=75105 RepID=UPI000566C09E